MDWIVPICCCCLVIKSLSHVQQFSDPMDYSPPGATVHGILQARLLELVAISFSRDLPNPGIEPMSPEWLQLVRKDSLPLSHLGSPWHDLKKEYVLLTKIMLLPAFLSSQALALSISFNSMNYSICFQQILFSTWWVKPSFSCLHNWLKIGTWKWTRQEQTFSCGNSRSR